MRKIFLFFSAVLASLAMQATVVTESINWTLGESSNTFTVNAWASAVKWDWMTGADEYEQLVIEVADHANDILVNAYFTTDGNSQITSSGIMRAGTNSVAVDVINPILQAIEVKNWSGNDGVEISVTNMYLRKTIGPKKTETLWEGSMYFDDFKAWDSEIILADNAFADAHVGDILEIDYTLDENTYHQMQVQTSYHQYRPTFLGTLDTYGFYNIEQQANPSKLSFAIMDAADLTQLQTDGGLRINGKFLTVTAVKLIRHEVLWTGTQAIGEWSGSTRVEASQLANLKVGNILCVRVSALTEGGQVLLQYADNINWYHFDPEVNYLFTGSDAAPMVVEIPVTYKMEQQLRGNALIAQGLNYTMTDIYVKEGTPVNTVAAYLHVTAAGMATYVLPFNVPVLPAGVQAYELTNDGSDLIEATEVNAMTADKPVLIIAAEGEYEFISEANSSDDLSGKTGTYANGVLIGTYTAINPLEQTTAGNYNYVLNNQGGNVAFYQVRDNSCSVPAYRAYLSCAHDASNNGANFAPKMRIVFHEDAATGVESQALKVNSQKFIKNGQIRIFRDGRIYNVLGQMAK